MTEEWRDVVGYDDMYKGMYQVSNLGRIRSLDRITVRGWHQNGRIMKTNLNSAGYMVIRLTKDGKGNTRTVHRLVALAFIDNTENKEFINHKDEDKTNNHVDNLEWVTARENNMYGTSIERQIKAKSKPIKVIYQDGTYEIWESTKIFAVAHSFLPSTITNVLKGKLKSNSYKGMRFEYV